MLPSHPQLTLAEFDVWALEPANVNTEYEYICGEVVLREVSDYWVSVIVTHLTTQMMTYVKQHKLGYMMGARMGFRVGNERYVPIASYSTHDRWIGVDEVCYLPFTPTLAIEAVSSLRHPKHLRRKITNYLNHNTPVWVINAEDAEIEVYRPNQPVHVYRRDEILSEEILTGFTISLATLFENES